MLLGSQGKCWQDSSRFKTEIIVFTIVGIGLYFTSDWVLRLIEARRGAPLPNRSIIFFVVILVLAIVSFEFIQRVLTGGSFA